jgi:hypothetical protein
MQRFFNCIFKKNIIYPNKEDFPSIKDYKYAGIVFTNGRHILAGYQPHKKTPFISGIGGKKNENETYIKTAIRETLEELFQITNFPPKLLHEIQNILIGKKIILIDNYISILCTFSDLLRIIFLLEKNKIKSVLYGTLPSTLEELIFQRKKNRKAEISDLVLLPLAENLMIDECFLNDFKKIIALI